MYRKYTYMVTSERKLMVFISVGDGDYALFFDS